MNRSLRTVLAATDSSPSGRTAVVRAASIARATGASLHAVHVGPTPDAIAADVIPASEDALRADIRRHLARIDPRPEIHLVEGTAFVEIVGLGRALDADLIVAGAHRGPPSRRFFLGTTAGRIARHGDRPLLVVRRPVHGPYRRVLVGVDCSPASAAALEAAPAIAPGATITPAMVTVAVGERKLSRYGGNTAVNDLRTRAIEDGRRSLGDFLTEHAATIETAGPVVDVGDPNERLPALPREQGCDLLAIGTHGRSAISYALLGSVAEHALRDSDGDVLLVRQDATRLHPT